MNNLPPARAIGLNCIDGRVQLPVINWIKQDAGVEFVDMITEPGMDGLISLRSNDLQAIFRKIDLSIHNNNSKIIYIIGHYDCRAHQVGEDEHKREIISAVGRLSEHYVSMPVVGLWVNSSWAVEVVEQKRPGAG